MQTVSKMLAALVTYGAALSWRQDAVVTIACGGLPVLVKAFEHTIASAIIKCEIGAAARTIITEHT
jgi:hypothetical protein